MKKIIIKAFTLIELMITVAIVGILAALAIPSYQDYSIRAQTTEGIVLATGAKSAVVDYYSMYGIFPPDHAAIGYHGGSGTYIINVNMENGKIFATFGTGSNSLITGKKIQLTPTANLTNGIIIWECGSDIEKKFLPSSCKGNI